MVSGWASTAAPPAAWISPIDHSGVYVVARDKGRTTSGEIAVERFVDEADVALLDHGARDVRSADGLARCLCQDLVDGQWESDLAQALAKPFNSVEPLAAQPGERLGQLLTRRIDEVAEDVDLGSADVRTHLNGRNDGDLSAVIVRQ